MDNKLLSALQDEGNFTYTENSAVTHKTSKSAVVDYFFMGASLRTQPPQNKYNLFRAAFEEDPNLALKILFYTRDIRGGQGERQSFRDIFIQYASEFGSTNTVKKLMNQIPEYGRWDDLVEIVASPMTPTAVAMYGAKIIQNQLLKDINNDNPSLLGKWLPSINASDKTRKKAFTLLRFLKIVGPSYGYRIDLNRGDFSRYRKMVSKLREKINIVETNLTEQNWDKINYEHVPSVAMMKYRKAFIRCDSGRFTEYISDVKSGTKKINTGTLYPYDVVRPILESLYKDFMPEEREALNTAWENLPNYLPENENSLVVCDTSGSMYPFAITVSTSLALYMAERNKGAFHNHFITFSGDPEFQKIQGKDLVEKITNLSQAEWGGNTDIQAVFEVILDTAVLCKIPKEDMPSRIYIISDMEFDQACTLNYFGFSKRSKRSQTNYSLIRETYAAADYKMPELVFWNVEARNTHTPITMDDNGVLLVGGCSPSILKNVLGKSFVTPLDVVKDTVDSPRYEQIRFYD